MQLVLSERFGLSAQVLAEFYANVVGKPRLRLALAQTDEWFELLCRYPIADVDSALVQRGVLIARTHRIGCWDGAIIAAAERLGAPILYTEDLNDGQLYGPVRAVNPFHPA